jgi:membrane protein required for colicin V production
MAAMNNLDYAIIAIVVLGGLYGLGRGAIRMATSILSLILAVEAASAWYERVGALLQQRFNASPSVAAVIGYLLVFIVVAALIEMVGRRIVRLANIINLGWIDRLGGALFGAALAVVFAGIDLLILAAVLTPNSTLIRDSRLAPRVLAYNQSLLVYVPPKAKEIFDQKREDLRRYWNGQNQSPAGTPSSGPSGT